MRTQAWHKPLIALSVIWMGLTSVSQPLALAHPAQRWGLAQAPSGAAGHVIRSFARHSAVVTSSLEGDSRQLTGSWSDTLINPPAQHIEQAGARIAASLRVSSDVGERASLATYTPPPSAEIDALAEGLNNDPRLIYEYVHNEYDFVPTWGLFQSPQDTVLSKAGNAFDQATVLLALLQAAGYQSEYVFGKVEIPLSQALNWFGVEHEQALTDALLYGGMPGQSDGANLHIDHVWVRVNVGGNWYSLDPSFKTYRYSNAIDLAQRSGYERSTFLSAAVQGAQIEGDYVRNINRANIASRLAQYATNLSGFLRDNAPFAYLDEIVGGREIVPLSVDQLPESLPNRVLEVLGQSPVMPDVHVVKWHLAVTGIDYTAYLPDIVGKRVTLFYYGATEQDRMRIAQAGGIFGVDPAYSVSMQPQLAVGGAVVATGSAVPLGSDQPIAMSVTTAILDEQGRPYTIDYRYEGGYLTVGEWYAFSFAAPCVSPAAVQRHRRLLAANLAAGYDTGSEQVLGQSLHLILLSWFSEVGSSDRLTGQMWRVSPIMQIAPAVMSQDVRQEWRQVSGQWKVARLHRAAYTIDVGFRLGGYVSSTADSDRVRAFRTDAMLRASEIEGAVIEQSQLVEAVSATRLIHVANARGLRIYHLTLANLERVLLVLAFPDVFKESLRAAVEAGFDVIVPQEPVSVRDWYGTGWLVYDPQSGAVSTWITGGIGWAQASSTAPSLWARANRGGGGAEEAFVDPEALNELVVDAPPCKDCNDPDPAAPNNAGDDPVDTSTGAFLHSAVDLSFGALGHPIRFARSYVSDRRLGSGPLGYGWTHSYDIHLAEGTDWVRAFGFRSPVDAVAAIAQALAGVDILSAPAGQLPQERIVMGCEDVDWLLSQATANVVTVDHGTGRSHEYLRLPDGTYHHLYEPARTLIQNGDGTYSEQTTDGSVLSFDRQGRAIGLEDANGNRTSFTYDSASNLIRVTDAAGRSIELIYNNRLLTQVTDPANRRLSFQYDGAGRLVRYTDARGSATRYAYDERHRIVSITDPEGIEVTRNVYDDLGRVVMQTNGRGATMSFRYGERQATAVDAMGYETVYLYDRYGRLVGNRDALGNRIAQTYDAADHITSRVDARGGITTSDYDARGNVTGSMDPMGYTTSFTYDAQDNLVGVTDALGRTTRFDYDQRRNPVRVTDALGNLSSLSYDSRGQLIDTTDANGHSIGFGYDPKGDMTQLVDPLNHASVLSRDVVGRPVAVTDRNGHTTYFEYDANDNLLRVTDPLGGVTSYAYDANNLLVSLTDPRGSTTRYAYDPQFNLISVTDALGHVTRYEYDGNDNLTRIVDANGHATTYQRDSLGRVVQITDPLGRDVVRTFDATGNLIAIRKADGNVIHYAHDADDRLTSVTYPDGSVHSYEHDAVHNIVGASQGTWSALYQYDGANLLVQEELPAEGLSLVYSYDDAANRERTQVLRGNSVLYDVRYHHDAANRLIRIVDELGDQTVSYSYDDSDNVMAIAYPGGATSSYTYDANNRIVGVDHGDSDGASMSRWTYVYDKADNPVQVTLTTPATSVATVYHYDLLNQLTRENYPRYSVEYAYDAVGNRTLLSRASGAINYVYDAADQLLSAGAVQFAYDANGNQTSRTDARGVYRYSYDYQDRLVQIEAPGGMATSFSYDPAGRRIGVAALGGERRFVYEGLTPLLEFGPVPGQGTSYIHGNDLLVWSRPLDPSLSALSLGYHGDALGSVVQLSDAMGMARGTHTYSAFGGAGKATAGGLQPYQFLGQFQVRSEWAANDLYLMGLRYYDATTGRFITPDPHPGALGRPALLNKYAYALNNPLRYIDPLGLRPETPAVPQPPWPNVSVHVCDFHKTVQGTVIPEKNMGFVVFKPGDVIWDFTGGKTVPPLDPKKYYIAKNSVISIKPRPPAQPKKGVLGVTWSLLKTVFSGIDFRIPSWEELKKPPPWKANGHTGGGVIG